MSHRLKGFALCVLLLVAAASVESQGPPLAIVRADPTGELEALADADQIRIVFSEPMVPLGAVPDGGPPPWIRIIPDVPGSFYWSGTRTLIFSPDASSPLPWATKFTVRVDGSATSAAGRRLGAPYELTFTTPTVRLLESTWYRRDQRFDRPIVIALRFNQPVKPEDVAAYTRVSLTPHEWKRPVLTPVNREQWRQADPVGLEQFDLKVAAVERVAASRDGVGLRVAESWDWRRTLFDPWLVVVETTSAPPPDAWLTVTIDQAMPSAGGPERHPEQSRVLELEPTFFAWSPGRGCIETLRGGAYCLGMTQATSLEAVARALTVSDLSDPGGERTVIPEPLLAGDDVYHSNLTIDLQRLGFGRQPPMSRWRLRLDQDLQSRDGQTLGYSWVEFSDSGHEGAAHGFGGSVFEAGVGSTIPLIVRNVSTLKQWLLPVHPSLLIPALQRLREGYGIGGFPTTQPRLPLHLPVEARSLTVVPDVVQRQAVDLRRVLPTQTGLVWATVGEAVPIPRSSFGALFPTNYSSAVVQVTNLGITAKYSSHSSLIFVTRLDTGAPVADAQVAIVDHTNTTRWSGRSGSDGVALVPALTLPDEYFEYLWRDRLIVTAEKGGDVAFVGSTWNQLGQGRSRAVRSFIWSDAGTALRGSVFTDRGVYRQTDTVHVKAVVRDDTPSGVRLLPAGSRLDVVVRDARHREIDTRTVTVNSWSSAEWTWPVPAGAPLGYYDIAISHAGSKPRSDWPGVAARFLVSAYRTPDFRVAATLVADAPILGSPLRGTITAEYLFGAPLVGGETRWWVSRKSTQKVPAAIRDQYPEARYTVGYPGRWEYRPSEPTLTVERGTLGADGRITFEVATAAGEDAPYEYTAEGNVFPSSGQSIAGRASIVVHPASLYVVMSRLPIFADSTAGVDVRIATADLSGRPVADVPVDVTLLRPEWTYPKDPFTPVMREVPLGTWSLRTTIAEVSLHIPAPGGTSYYIVRATARDAAGRPTRTEGYFYGRGRGRASWRSEGNRIELTPERSTLKPGETARILVQSPWERATALLTVEREGVRRHRTFTISSTQDVIDVPITEADVPNVFVSVVLVKGRTSRDLAPAGSDPGRPQYRVGHAELLVDDASKRLRVDVSTDRHDYRPGESATVSMGIATHDGRAQAGEVTLWAVDYGVLSLTRYTTPDVLKSIYPPKSLHVMTSDNRERLLMRPDSDGADGAQALGDILFNGHSVVDVQNARMASSLASLFPGLRRDDVREDFRPLVFWLGSVRTGADGRARTTVRLPDSLTTYRIMAVAGDRASRFGFGEHEIRTTKTLTLLPVFPRFLSPGDRAFFGAVLTYTGLRPGEAVVTIESRDAETLRFGAPASRKVRLEPGVSQPVTFEAVAGRLGRAHVRMTVRRGAETDAFELPLAVTSLVRPETTAAYGEVSGNAAVESLALPPGALPHLGGLSVELASTALVGLGESARYVTDYWHRGGEQRASRALVLLLASEFDGAFHLSNVPPTQLRAAGAAELRALWDHHCEVDGGIALWPGVCTSVSPYLTTYILHVMHVARTMGIDLDQTTVDRGLGYLDHFINAPSPRGERWVVWASAQAYAFKVLAEYGRTPKTSIAPLLAEAERLPVFAVSFLADALHTQGERGPRYQDLVRRITNTIRVNADRAHVEESDDSSLAWLWHSTIGSTAIVLEGLARRDDAPALVAPLVRWLLASRTNGRWGTTHENARALEALFAYYRTLEGTAPRMTATVSIGSVKVGGASFRRRAPISQQVILPMRDLLQHLGTGNAPLSISRTGVGRVYYTARVQSFVPEPAGSVDRGFRVERRYARFVENVAGPPTTTFSAGDLVRVTVSLTLRGEGRYLALTDPLPAGFEPIEGAFQTTERRLVVEATRHDDHELWDWWRRGTFDHVEKHDDRIVAFATWLGSGRHEFSYLVRATIIGSFGAAGARVEAMYAPELIGRSAAVTVQVR